MGRLTRQDIRLLNAYENLTNRPLTKIQRVPVKKSELDQALEAHKIEKLNTVCNNTYTTVNDNAQNISSRWSVAVKALEDLKDAVDLNDFMIYEDFNALYEVALQAIDEYEKQLRKAIQDTEEFCLDLKAIMPNDER